MNKGTLDLSRARVQQFLVDRLPEAPDAGPFIEYAQTRIFTSDNGETFDAGRAGIIPSQAALLFYLVRTLQPEITIETGFGAGASAGLFVTAKQGFANRLHMSVDPFAVFDMEKSVVKRYLERKYPDEFKLVREFSELALPAMVKEYQGRVKLGFVDGGHHFDTALMDMTFIDKMLPQGGVIVVDDVIAPAVETACHFWRVNREDYVVYEGFPNTLVFEKVAPRDPRNWDHFRPFPVAQRIDWDCGV